MVFLLDDKAKAEKLISTEMREMCAFQLEMHDFVSTSGYAKAFNQRKTKGSFHHALLAEMHRMCVFQLKCAHF